MATATISAVTSRARHTPVSVISTDGMDERTWLQYRRKGIGGSDLAALRQTKCQKTYD